MMDATNTLKKEQLLGRLHHTLLADAERGFALGEAGRVHHLADTCGSASLLQPQTRGARVRHDVASDGFQGVLGEDAAVGVRHDLVGDDDGDAVLVRQFLESAEELR